MPLIEVTLYEDRLGDGKAAELIEKMTNVLCEVYGEFMRDYTTVLLHEQPKAWWGIAGKPAG